MADRLRCTRWLLLAVFFLSGACALTYQVVWIRLLNLAFGATNFAMAVVLATFMGGLGLGSLLAARWAERLSSPISAYARLEALIAAFGLVAPLLIRSVDRVQAALLDVDSPVALVLAVQITCCAVPLLVPTTAMGATLPILSRWIAQDETTRGRDLGLLYALNTLGAFVGTLFAGFYAIEHLGVSGTNLCAVVVNILVAVLALRMARDAEMQPLSRPADAASPPRQLLVLAAGAGLLGLAHEVIWTRLLGLLLANTTYAFTLILAVVIGGIGLGSLLGGRRADRVPDPVLWFGQLQGVIAIGALALFPLLVGILRFAPDLLDTHQMDFGSGQVFAVVVCVLVMAVPATAMGAAFPALARAITMGG